MNPYEKELAELSERLRRLEVEVAALRGGPPVAPVAAARPDPLAADALAVPPELAVEAEPPLLAAAPVAVADAAPAKPVQAAGYLERVGSVSSTTWVAAAGAVIFLIGAIYGLTVSIQRGWISPPVRVGLGLLVGLGAGTMAARLLFKGRRELGVTLLAVGAGTWVFALYFGAKSAHLFPLGLGFAGTAVATVLAGFIAARVRSDGAMAVALAVGLVAPLAFSDRTGHLAGLNSYLALLLAAQLVAHYATGEGAGWTISRLLGSAGVWGVALIGVLGAKLAGAPVMFLSLAALGTLGLVLAWLPRHRTPSEAPQAVSVLVLIAWSLGTWNVWRRLRWEGEWFAPVLVAFAALSVALLWAGRRSGRDGSDHPLALLATGFALLAVPVAIEWRWVGLAWGLGAVLLASAARRKVADGEAEGPVMLAAALVAMAATAVWLVQALGHWSRPGDAIFLNPVFAGGALAAAAWAMLMGTTVGIRPLGFVLAQAVLVNAVAWEFARSLKPIAGEAGTLPVGMLLATVTYALAGIGPWLRGVLYESDEVRARALRLAGYMWLFVATVKLLGFDLSDRDLLFRAVAALGVGTMFIAAALWADRVRAGRGEP